jgi:adenosine deaminase
LRGHHSESGGRVVLCVSEAATSKIVRCQNSLVSGSFLSLQTDDVGIFTSPLSNEYLIAAQYFHLSRQELLDLCRGAIDVIFGDESEKERLRCLVFKKDQG